MDMNKANWSLIPEHCRAGLREWIENGVVPGGFLCAVLENDLSRAVQRADMTNRKALPDYVTFLYTYAPRGSWGSPRNMEKWAAHQGLKGRAAATQA